MILRCPVAPSCCHSSSLGMTTVNTCMMMLDVMYGMMPKAKIANEENAPPENKFKKPRAPCSRADSRNCRTARSSIPGTRICAPRRYKSTIIKVNKILFRRSGTLKMFFRFDSTWVPRVLTRCDNRSARYQRLVNWLPLAAGRTLYGNGMMVTEPPAASMAACAALETP